MKKWATSVVKMVIFNGKNIVKNKFTQFLQSLKNINRASVKSFLLKLKIKTGIMVIVGISSCFMVHWLYQRPHTFDATYLKNNTLSSVSKTLLSQLDSPFTLELITPNQEIINKTKSIMTLFQKHSNHIKFSVHQTTLSPAEKRAFHLQSNHSLLLNYKAQKKVIDLGEAHINEDLFTNFIYQILRNKEEWVVFLSGHGEQPPTGAENRHFGNLTTDLKKKGLNIAAISTSETGVLPDNTKILVIADNQQSLMPKEIDLILKYLQGGGNLLWLVNPDSTHGLEKLEEVLGIRWINGTISDPKAHAMGTPHPAISVILQYPTHPLTQSLDALTVFPWARPIDYSKSTSQGWEAQPFLTTQNSTFLEKEKSKPSTTLSGPFNIGVTLRKGDQRVVLIGNSHFISNSTVHNYGNLTLANHIFNWLSESDLLLPPAIDKKAIDLAFTDTSAHLFYRQYLFPYILPFSYLFIAWIIRLSRQQRLTLSFRSFRRRSFLNLFP